MKEKPVQYFSKEYLEYCKLMTPMQILQFEEDFCKLMAQREETVENEKKQLEED